MRGTGALRCAQGDPSKTRARTKNKSKDKNKNKNKDKNKSNSRRSRLGIAYGCPRLSQQRAVANLGHSSFRLRYGLGKSLVSRCIRGGTAGRRRHCDARRLRQSARLGG